MSRDTACRVTAHESTVVVRGELDLASAPYLRRELARLLEEVPGELYLDLAGVSFMDSHGLEALTRSQEAARGRGGELVLARRSRQVDRLLEIIGMTLPAARPQR